jgi:hypothetical protein
MCSTAIPSRAHRANKRIIPWIVHAEANGATLFVRMTGECIARFSLIGFHGSWLHTSVISMLDTPPTPGMRFVGVADRAFFCCQDRFKDMLGEE